MRNFYIILIITLFTFGVVFGVIIVFAQESLSVTFPVKELGGCKNFKECAVFCDQSQNLKICNDFAEDHGIVTSEEAEKSRQILEAAEDGPGGCQGKDECETYCDVPEHMEECLVFAIENNLIPADEIEDAKKALEAIRKGFEPPPCKGKKECDIYCSQEEHLKECLEFGEAAGFISQKEAEMVKKTGGKGPGNCRGKEQCDKYCSSPEHMEDCMNFGIEHNLIPPEEIEDVKKILQAIKKGVKPPNCRNREECDVYCSQPEHAEECIEFSIVAGFISPEESEQVRKMAKLGIIRGPGGCKGKEECKTFCDNPDNMLECVEFAEKAGFMSPEEAKQAKKMAELGISNGPGGCKGKDECEAFCQNPDNQEECLEFGVKAGFMSPEQAEKSKKMMGLKEKGGPGGCNTPEICNQYCSIPRNMEECMEFGQKMGLVSPEEVERAKEFGPDGPGGPGGCKNKEECEVYCGKQEHSEECINFSLNKGYMSSEEAEKMRQGIMILRPGGQPGPIPLPGEGQRFIGPGGCQTPEECTRYCSQSEHSQECGGFLSPDKGTTAPGGMVPLLPEGYIPYTPEGIMPPPSGQTPPPPSGETQPPLSPYLETPLLPPSSEPLSPSPSETAPTTVPSSGEMPQTFLDLVSFLMASISGDLLNFTK